MGRDGVDQSFFNTLLTKWIFKYVLIPRLLGGALPGAGRADAVPDVRNPGRPDPRVRC